MTFLELCNRVFVEGDRAPYELTTTDVSLADTDEQVYKIVQWVKQAYQEIQLWDRHFKFHWKSATLITTEADTQDYKKCEIRNLLRDSLYAKRSGDTIGWELTYLTYKQWRDQFLNTNLSPGLPSWFVELPNGDFRLEPMPDAVYNVTADWYIHNDRFEVDDDEPIWAEDLHELVVWVALQYYMSEYETPEELATRVRLGMRHSKKEFLLRYLPDLEITGTFG